ncbi:hypothetical protein [Nostoc sp.]|uniref:hypothetical protein n=1 Tax=Nostoc sp. TaxID=1180 RepID=UPI003FA56954
MAGQIVTINDAALELLGCPIGDANSKNNKLLWERQLDKIRVKGKHQAVNIYELIGDRTTELDANTQEFLLHYHTGRAAYLSRNFSQAIACFEAAKCIKPQDQAVDIHLERVHNYQQTPPPESWDGVWTMLTK